jgi:hypothetical protein
MLELLALHLEWVVEPKKNGGPNDRSTPESCSFTLLLCDAKINWDLSNYSICRHRCPFARLACGLTAFADRETVSWMAARRNAQNE